MTPAAIRDLKPSSRHVAVPGRSRSARALTLALALSLGGMGIVQEARAALIGTDAVARAQSGLVDAAVAANPEQARARVLALLERDDAVQALSTRGVDPQEARARVAALTDEEALDLARRIGKAPAGAGVLETIGFVFVVLLITDILGFTKVFPFTRSIR